jgi:cytochrome c oxidase subunit 4
MNDTHAAETKGHVAHHAHEPLSCKFLTLIWVGLMILTATTVAIAEVNLGEWNIVLAMAVASCKAALVIFFFMHLKYENWVIKGMVLTAFVILAIAIGLTFVDVGLRY